MRKARETLERAIDLVNNTPRWGARVVYGDTDRCNIDNVVIIARRAVYGDTPVLGYHHACIALVLYEDTHNQYVVR